MMTKQCNCETECSRWGVYESRTGGYFCPYNPFDDSECKRIDNEDMLPHTIKNYNDE
jgi:hypothetical protein